MKKVWFNVCGREPPMDPLVWEGGTCRYPHAGHSRFYCGYWNEPANGISRDWFSMLVSCVLCLSCGCHLWDSENPITSYSPLNNVMRVKETAVLAGNWSLKDISVCNWPGHDYFSSKKTQCLLSSVFSFCPRFWEYLNPWIRRVECS